jgi:Gas vesicle protein G
MGLITGLLTLPLAPVRGIVWVAEQIEEEAERQFYDPAAIEAALEDIQRRREAHLIPDAEADSLEESLIERLVEGGFHG